MTTLTRDKVVQWIKAAGFAMAFSDDYVGKLQDLEDFATLARADLQQTCDALEAIIAEHDRQQEAAEAAGQADAATIAEQADEIERMRGEVVLKDTELYSLRFAKVELTAQRDELLAALRLIEPNKPFAGWENSEGEEIGTTIDSIIANCNNKEK